MTYHLERTLTFRNHEKDEVNKSPEFDKERKFPEKLWEVASDSCTLITWTPDGSAVQVNSDRFEAEVMSQYPGFMQISSFANFRRQFRWYGYFWEYLGDGDFEFSHPYFLRDHKDLVHQVLTRRKALRLRNPVLGRRRRSERSAKLDFTHNYRSARTSMPPKRVLQYKDGETYQRTDDLGSGETCIVNRVNFGGYLSQPNHCINNSDKKLNIKSDSKTTQNNRKPCYCRIDTSNNLVLNDMQAGGDAGPVLVREDEREENDQLRGGCCCRCSPAVPSQPQDNHDRSLDNQHKLMYFLADAELYQLYTSAKADFHHAEFYEREQAQPVKVTNPSKENVHSSLRNDLQDSTLCVI